MLTVLLWALTAVAVLLGGLLVLLAFPVRLRFDARLGRGGQVRVDLGLLGGLVPWITVHDSAKPAKRKVKRKLRRKRPVRRRRGRSGRLSPARLLRAGPELIGGLLARVRVERLRAEAAFGLGDPAETGQLYGMLAPVVLAPQWLAGPHISTKLTPVFDRRFFSGELQGALAVTPLGLLVPGLRFAWRVFGPGR